MSGDAKRRGGGLRLHSSCQSGCGGPGGGCGGAKDGRSDASHGFSLVKGHKSLFNAMFTSKVKGVDEGDRRHSNVDGVLPMRQRRHTSVPSVEWHKRSSILEPLFAGNNEQAELAASKRRQRRSRTRRCKVAERSGGTGLPVTHLRSAAAAEPNGVLLPGLYLVFRWFAATAAVSALLCSDVTTARRGSWSSDCGFTVTGVDEGDRRHSNVDGVLPMRQRRHTSVPSVEWHKRSSILEPLFAGNNEQAELAAR
nr:hypothetical protein Itr_chr06CG16170 [Ipomoea trifida]